MVGWLGDLCFNQTKDAHMLCMLSTRVKGGGGGGGGGGGWGMWMCSCKMKAETQLM